MRALFIAIPLTVGLALTGCGGSDDDRELGKITPAEVAAGEVEPDAVEANLRQQLEDKGEADRVKRLDCPKRRKLRKREVFYCVLTAEDGSKARLTVVPDRREGGVRLIDAKPLK